MEGEVPDAVAWRRDKVGFETPEGEWLRDWVRAEPALFRETDLVRPYLDIEAARRTAAAWAAGDRHGAPPLWRWINLEAWLRVWRAADRSTARS
jgi:asparagine synthase (glutamine-hydrolysing)